MKKRIVASAIVVGVLLSFCASAWADDYYFGLGNVTAEPISATAKAEDEVTVTFTVDVPYNKGEATTNAPYKNANLLKWTVDGGETDNVFTPTSVTANKTNNPSTNAIDGITQDAAYLADQYLIIPEDLVSGAGSDGGTLNYTIAVTGTLGANYTSPSDIHISVSLCANDGETYITSYPAGTSSGYSQQGESKETTVSADDDDDDEEEDTDYVRNYRNAYDASFDEYFIPTSEAGFSSAGGDAGKGVKPKFTTKSVSALTAGTPKSFDITFQGGRSKAVTAYIAGKDAVKLFGLDKEAKDTNIYLTKANIQTYGIPFRVISYDLSSADSKTASNKIVVEYNGGKVQAKAYPLTFAASSAQTKKPVTKTYKIDITPNTSEPVWLVPVTSTDYAVSGTPVYSVEETTHSLAEYEAALTAFVSYVESWATKYADADADLNDDEFHVDEDATISETIISRDEGNLAVISPDNSEAGSTTVYVALGAECLSDVTYYLDEDEDEDDYKMYVKSATLPTASTDAGFEFITATVDVPAYAYSADYSFTIYKVNTNKKGVELEIKVGDGLTGAIPETLYKVSSDAQYVITVKPALDKTKNGVKYEIVDPNYSGLGDFSTDIVPPAAGVSQGSVAVSGKLETTTKETKTALTLTATNPLTKKKSQLKVTVIGKLAPYFDDKTMSNGYLTKVKRVEAGKVPSIKPKAKGSKTITYSIPDADDRAALVNHGLSFDVKKGAITGTKGKTLPTLNDKGDAFESLDITIRATNGVGKADIKAQVAITGAKPKFGEKTATFTAGERKYVALAQKVGSTSVKGAKDGVSLTFSPATDTDKTTLSSNGLSIVTWEEILVPKVSKENALSTDVANVVVNVASDEVLGTWSEKSGTNYTNGYFTSGDKYFVYARGALSHDTTKDVYVAGKGGVVAYSADVEGGTATVETEPVYYSKDVTVYVASPDASLMNCLIIQANGKQAAQDGGKDKKVKINVIADNYGATAKGAITVTIKKPASSSALTVVSAAGNDIAANTAGSKSNSAAAKRRAGDVAGYDYDAEAEDEAEVDEKDALTFGAPRTAANLTAAQKALLAEKGYTVVAVLPEITAKTEGQHDVEVELDEEAPEGATLIWLPFPKDAGSEDDDIVDFYDEAGALVEGVPASHKIIASPWFREGVTYEPVIAVEAE